MKAKSISKWGKVTAMIWVVGAFVVNGIFKLDFQTWDIIYIGLFLAVMVSPIDVSIWLDKISAIRRGLKE